MACGRLVQLKGFDDLIKAFFILRDMLDARLIILGDGPERKSLGRMIDDYNLMEYVDMPGFVANPYMYMHRASVFVLSSHWEGFGLVLVEALVAGVPVVATNCPTGPNEILEGESWGN